MESQTVIRTSISFDPVLHKRLDEVRGSMERSTALNKILSYILSQPDYWLKELLGVTQNET